MSDPIIIVSPGGMVSQWIGPCLSSAIRQTLRPTKHLVWTPDAKAIDVAKRYMSLHPDYPIEFREDNGCALANIIPAIHEMAPETIVVCLDLDDWFCNDRAIEIVAKTYEDKPDCFSTAGQFRFWPGGGAGFAAPYPPEVERSSAWRQHDWLWTHLKTFRAGVAKQIRVEDLKQLDGEWMREVADLALCYPILEMADGRVKFIPDVLYEYNTGNDASVHNVVGEKMLHVQRETARIRAMPRYERIERPW